MARLSCDHECPSRPATEALLSHYAQDSLVIDGITFSTQMVRQSAIAIGWPLRRQAVEVLAKLDLLGARRIGRRGEPIESRSRKIDRATEDRERKSAWLVACALYQVGHRAPPVPRLVSS